jgi:FkbM family methyltransferase
MISTEKFCDYAKKYNLIIDNVYEIGSLHGHDAEKMRTPFNVKPSNVYVFEAHPTFSEEIKKNYPEFNVVNNAVSNKNGYIKFNAVEQDNVGISSLREYSKSMINKNEMNGHYHNLEYNQIEVKCVRMDTWIEENDIKSIDILKIDVEGCTYECLESFGLKLNIIKLMHIEAEHIECWENQILYEDIKKHLENNNFQLLEIVIAGPPWAKEQQSDSVWINKKYLE